MNQLKKKIIYEWTINEKKHNLVLRARFSGEGHV